MNLPIYHQTILRSTDLDEVSHILSQDMNMRQPCAISLMELSMPDQLEIIGLVENYFTSNNISFLYPYPVYLITVHDPSVSRVPMVKSRSELPRFFAQRDNKTNVKELGMLSRNKLLQQEIKNCDSLTGQKGLASYAAYHRTIFKHESEQLFYQNLLSKLKREGHG
jgi:hypothetical protein